MKVRSLVVAEDDARSAAEYLESERTGLRQRFFQEFRRVVANIRRFPQMYALVDDNIPGHEIRNAILERLKFRIVYFVAPTEVVIVAVDHTSRRPGHWHQRLNETPT